MKLSDKALGISPSMTVAIADKARSLKAKGEDVISFATGEPDFPTPEAIKEEGINWIRKDYTKYAANAGIPELKIAIRNKLLRENGLDYQTNEIIVANGAKQIIFEAFGVLLNPGDEVIITTPCWVSYVEQAKIFGGVVKLVSTSEENNFRVEAADIAAAITPHTKAILLNSPNNPSGAIISEDELKKIVRLAVDNDLFIISDEVYEKLTYDGNKCISVAAISEEAKARTITVNSLSKSYCMTGWRVGYAAANKAMAKAMGSMQSHMTGGVCGFNQKAAAYGLENFFDFEPFIANYAKRRDYITARFNAMPGVHCVAPDGAFYVFPNVQSFIGKSDGDRVITSSLSLAEYLIDTVKIACVAGEAFSMPGYLRFTFAISMERIVEGTSRVAEAFARLR